MQLEESSGFGGGTGGPLDQRTLESDYTRPTGNDADSNTDLTDIDAFAHEDNKDEAWLFPNEDHLPGYYLEQLEIFNKQEYTKQDYKDNSTCLLNRMEKQWNQCWTYLKKDQYRAYETVSVTTLHTFFDWLLSQRQGKGRRKRQGTKLASSLGTAAGVKLDAKMNRSMHKVLRKLAKKHNLKKIGRDKACMYVEDLAQVLQTNLVTTKKRYPYGRYRIQAQLYLQL
ncbi:hypothetical protein EJ02DRAFT_460087, partial [Clathrospora elynae]